jgi:hypothetical protein
MKLIFLTNGFWKNVSKLARVINDTSNLDYIQQYFDGSVKISFTDLNLSNRVERPLLINEMKEGILLLVQFHNHRRTPT